MNFHYLYGFSARLRWTFQLLQEGSAQPLYLHRRTRARAHNQGALPCLSPLPTLPLPLPGQIRATLVWTIPGVPPVTSLLRLWCFTPNSTCAVYQVVADTTDTPADPQRRRALAATPDAFAEAEDEAYHHVARRRLIQNLVSSMSR